MSTTFLSTLDEVSKTRVVNAVTSSISKSFLDDSARQTQAEIKRRFEISVLLVATMRKDLGWSWTRINDLLPNALRCVLDNGSWSPPQNRAGWVTDDSTGLILPTVMK